MRLVGEIVKVSEVDYEVSEVDYDEASEFREANQ